MILLVLVVNHRLCFFFCKQRTAYELRIGDWSSDVSSDLLAPFCCRCARYAQSGHRLRPGEAPPHQRADPPRSTARGTGSSTTVDRRPVPRGTKAAVPLA